MSETIVATVEKVRYRKDPGNWCIIATDAGVCKGVIPFEVQPGDQIKLHDGFWARSDFSGKDEFSFDFASINIPSSLRDLLHVVCLRAKGIGDVKEREIWDRYGENWQGVMHLEIKGITEAANAEWRKSLERLTLHREQDETLAFLLASGCTELLAYEAWAKWGNSTVAKVTADPYILATLPGRGFKTVDADPRRHFGIDDADPRRAKAAITYVIAEIIQSGNTAIRKQVVAAECVAMMGTETQRAEKAKVLTAAFRELVASGEVVMIDADWITSKAYARYELAIFRRFSA
ncbi:MAG: hypothetical protein OEQ39_02960 [Gammaproteobacteria bacterium]|nr:hypothetical protein [Gammaproteobacteria bacterium]MDH3375910.1 hypothetical protein [Gammaproteobacteria bacterium]